MLAASEHRRQLATFAVLLADGRELSVYAYSKDDAKRRVLDTTFHRSPVVAVWLKP